MATKPQIAVAITATNELSGVLATIRKDMEAAGREARDLGADLGKALSSRGLSPGQLRGSIGRAVGRAGMIPGLGAIAGAGSMAGIGEIVTRYTSMGVTLGNTARAAGTTAQGLNTLRGSARMLGLSSETADQAMTGLNTTIADAFYGKNPQAAAAFQQFGIGLEGIGGKAKRAEDLLPRIADEVRRIAKVDPRAAVTLMNALGISPEAMPLLMQGAEGLKRYREEVQRLDPITADSVAASQHFTEAMARLGIASDRVGRTIATALEPHLTPMLTHLSEWVSSHGPDIGDTFDHLGKAIAGVHWSDVGTQIEHVGQDVAAVTKYLEDFGVRMERVTTNVGNFIHLVQTPGRVFYDLLQKGGDIPQVDDMGRPIEGTGGVAPRRYRHFPGDQGQSLGPSAPTPVSREQEERAVRGRDILTGLGWSPEQAAGIMANLHAESKMNEGAVGDGGQAYGVAQWHPDRREAIRVGTGRSVVGMSFEDQVRAVDWELRNNEKAAGDKLRGTRTAAEAGDIVSRSYERPANVDVDASNRAASADAFDRRWARTPSPQAPPPPSPYPDAPIAASAGEVTTSSGPKSEQALSDQRNARWAAHRGMSEQLDSTEAIVKGMISAKDYLTSNRASQGGAVQIDINHNGAPEGTDVKASATGGAEVGGIRTQRAMSGKRRDDG